jgi:hypothetical protein
MIILKANRVPVKLPMVSSIPASVAVWRDPPAGVLTSFVPAAVPQALVVVGEAPALGLAGLRVLYLVAAALKPTPARAAQFSLVPVTLKRVLVAVVAVPRAVQPHVVNPMAVVVPVARVTVAHQEFPAA